jgi:hypothetical protein
MRRLPNKGFECVCGFALQNGPCFAFRIRGATRRLVMIIVAVARCLGSAKNPERRDDDLSHCLRPAFPILELPRLQAPFDEDYGPFRHKPFGNLRQLNPTRHSEPIPRAGWRHACYGMVD